MPTAQWLDMLEIAQAVDELTDIIEGLRIGNCGQRAGRRSSRWRTVASAERQ